MTARSVYHVARKAGVSLSVKGESITYVGPSGAMSPALAAMIRLVKPELNALLCGWYIDAALHLMLRETTPGRWREDLAIEFDARVAGCVRAGKSYDAAYRTAYIELARQVEIDTATTGAAA